MGERRRLREQLERQAVAGVVGVEQVAREREQAAAILGLDPIDRQVLVQPRAGLGIGERRGAGASRCR
jgi:hypothetical protein